jgi:DMSO/TMAO reductase YedYZ molybdopterin-dependent catalytic subunit
MFAANLFVGCGAEQTQGMDGDTEHDLFADGDNDSDVGEGDAEPQPDWEWLESPPSGTATVLPTEAFLRSEPYYLQVLSEAPEAVTLFFNYPVLVGSQMRIWREKQPVGELDSMVLSSDGLSLRMELGKVYGPGVYDVRFSILTPNGLQNGYIVFYQELREHEGYELDSILNFRENSIRGPQYVDLDDYELVIDGLVENPIALTYGDVLAFDQQNYIAQLNCVEGWHANVLWEGVPIARLLDLVKPDPDASVMILYGADGYYTSIRLSWFEQKDILLAAKMNGLTLPAERGFPFELAARGKWGYKWIKWVTRIELSDDENYQGYWESAGYSNTGDLDEPFWTSGPPPDDPRVQTPFGCTVR